MRKPHRYCCALAMLLVGADGSSVEDHGTTACGPTDGLETCEASTSMNENDYKDQKAHDADADADTLYYYQQEHQQHQSTDMYQHQVDNAFYQVPQSDPKWQYPHLQQYRHYSTQEAWSSTGYGPDDDSSIANSTSTNTTRQETFHSELNNHNANMANEACVDKEGNCGHWAMTGECQNNPQYMNDHCQRSCNLCSIPPTYTFPHYGEDLGVPQVMMRDPDGAQLEDVQSSLNKARSYMHHAIASQKYNNGILHLSKNRHTMCALWALDGLCHTQSEWMLRDCGPSCESCHVHTIEGRCPVDPTAPNAWEPGDLNRLFSKLSSEPYLSQYEVQILSSPDTTAGPWILTMENFVTKEEAERFIEFGSQMGFEQSAGVGNINADGTIHKVVNEGRTSTNTWCQPPCSEDELIRGVTERLNDLMEIPDPHSEYLQLLKYEEDQFYGIHHDYLALSRDRQEGCRILTAYLYLSEVEAGGGTQFDKLDVTVMPKQGRMVLWPSVLDKAPHDKDERTTHTALPVEKGVKYGANAWFHQRDFKTPHRNSCL